MSKYTSFLLPAIIALGAFGVLATPRADADTIIASFDIGPTNASLYSGDPVLDSDGLQLTGKTGAWTIFNGTDSTSGTNNVSLSFSASALVFDDGGGTPGDTLRRDVFYISGTTERTVTIQGLDAFTAYQVVFYGQYEVNTSNNPSDISFLGDVGSAGILDLENDTNFASVTTDGSGSLAFFWDVGPTGTSSISGIQVAVPEPSAYAAIAGFLALGWVMLRRRA